MKTVSSFLCKSLGLLLSCLIAFQCVYADVKPISYSEIGSIYDIEAVVNNPSSPSVTHEYVGGQGADFSPTYSITVPQNGWLFLPAFSKKGSDEYTSNEVLLFSDKNLISQIASHYAQGKKSILVKYVTAGTYYFVTKWSGIWSGYKFKDIVFPAFRPRIIKTVPVQYNVVSSLDGLKGLIDGGVAPSSSEYFESYQADFIGNIHKFTLPSKGTLYVKNFAVNGTDRDSTRAYFSLYTDQKLVNEIAHGYTSSDRYFALSLAAGTYYYTNYVYSFYPSNTSTVRNYLGFAPDVKLSAPKLRQYKRFSKKVIGRAAPGSTVHLTVQGKKYIAKVNAKGNFTVKLKKKLMPRKKIKVYVTLGSKRSKTTTVKVR